MELNFINTKGLDSLIFQNVKSSIRINLLLIIGVDIDYSDYLTTVEIVGDKYESEVEVIGSMAGEYNYNKKKIVIKYVSMNEYLDITMYHEVYHVKNRMMINKLKFETYEQELGSNIIDEFIATVKPLEYKLDLDMEGNIEFVCRYLKDITEAVDGVKVIFDYKKEFKKIESQIGEHVKINEVIDMLDKSAIYYLSRIYVVPYICKKYNLREFDFDENIEEIVECFNEMDFNNITLQNCEEITKLICCR